MKEKTQSVDSRWKMIFNGRKIEALYLWFVFMNQPDMAKYLCSRSRVRHILCSRSISHLNYQNQTVATLLAVEIYFKAATKNNDSLKETAQ